MSREFSYLVLGLEGDFQSYGTDSKFYERASDAYPSKSAVVGMIIASMGWFEPTPEQLSIVTGDLRVDGYVRNDSVGGRLTTLVDFQMMGAGYDASDKKQAMMMVPGADSTKNFRHTKISKRHYIMSAKYRVILKVPTKHAKSLVEGLRDPAYGPFLGRKACIPTAPIFRALCGTLKEAESMELFKSMNRFVTVYDGVRDDVDGESILVNDVPVKYGCHHEYRSRYITIVAGQPTI